MSASVGRAIMVWVSAGKKAEADRIARVLVDEKLAACVSIVPGAWSRYRWKGKTETSPEVFLLIKTLASAYPRLEKRIKQLHSYEVPEILAVPVWRGSSDYLKWLRQNVSVR